MRPRSTRLSRGLVAASAVTLLSGLGVAAVASQASAAAGCRVTYSANSWSTGFTGNLNLTNLGDPISGGWTLTWDFAGNQHITQGWSATISQSGQHVTATNPSWASSLGTNASANFGFNADYSGTNVNPTSFSLNGVACTGSTPTSPPPTSVPPTSTPPTSPPPTSVPPTSPPPTNTPPGTKADNPYAGVKGYVNPEWKAKADAEPGGTRVSSNPTAVWLDRIAAIAGTTGSSSNGSMGVRAHLDAALAQGAGYIQFVIYDLPGRDCSALASNGELGTGDIQRYKTEYVDPIAAIESDAKYKNIRIINVVEIDSLPNLVTNTNVATCATMKANGGYVNGIAYALQKFGAIGNVYNYLDAAHHGWIGWDSNFGPTADLMYQTAVLSGSVNNVTGFITNTANYSALTEPYFNSSTTVNGQTVKQSKWVDWNPYVDELSFAQAFRNRLVQSGFNSNIGMLIDTSRNGWGGANRPTKASTSTDVNTFVNESRIDRRIHAGNWCNQSGAGLGERPRANPATGIDAYVWVKPPGESDGSSSLIPNSEGKGFDRMCDPTYTGNDRNGNSLTGALPGAPISGAWFSAQFQQLMTNAYPAL
jgi:cellulose 1,4-beta-cellobiosidase